MRKHSVILSAWYCRHCWHTDRLKCHFVFWHNVGALQQYVFPGNVVAGSWHSIPQRRESLSNLLIFRSGIPRVWLDKIIIPCFLGGGQLLIFFHISKGENCKKSFSHFSRKRLSFNTLFLFIKSQWREFKIKE